MDGRIERVDGGWEMVDICTHMNEEPFEVRTFVCEICPLCEKVMTKLIFDEVEPCEDDTKPYKVLICEHCGEQI